MARKKGENAKVNESPNVTKAEVAREVAELAATAQRGDLRNRLAIGEILNGRGSAFTAEEVAKEARQVYARKDGYGTVSGLSPAALSKYQTVHTQYIAAGLATVDGLAKLNAKMEKLYAWASEPENVRREFIAEYASAKSTPNGQRTRNRTSINVSKDVMARFLEYRHVFGVTEQDDRGALHDAIMTAMLDRLDAMHGTEQESESAHANVS